MRTNISRVCALIAFLAATVVARANQSGASGGKTTVLINHSVPGMSTPPPAAPSTPTGKVASSSQVQLQWTAAQPAAGRTINHYDIYLNGMKVGSVTGTSIVAPFNASPSALQFYSVVAVDDKGNASPASGEILVSGEIPTAFQAKEGYILDSKYGIRGFAPGSCRTYQHIVGTQHDEGTVDSGTTLGTYSLLSNLTIDEQMISLTGGNYFSNFQINVSGTSTVTFLGTNLVQRANWVLDPSGTHVTSDFITLSPVPFFYTLPHVYAPSVSSQFDALWAYAITSSAGITRSYTMTLSNEDTDAALFQRSDAHRAQIDATFDQYDWSMYVEDTANDGSDPWVQSFTPNPASEMIASRWDVSYGGATSDRYDEWGHYRFVTGSRGMLHARWFEVFEPNDGTATSVMSTHDVNIYGGDSGTQTTEFLENPPTIAGGGNVYICQIPTGIQLQTPSVNPVAGQPRLYSRDALFVNQVTDLDLRKPVASPVNQPTADAIALCTWGGKVVANITGDPDSIRLVAVDPTLIASKGLPAAVAQGTNVPSGTNILPYLAIPYGSGGPRDIVAVGATVGTGVITLHLINYYYTVDVVKTITVYPVPTLAVDANRDGQVDLPPQDPSQPYADQTSSTNPCRFWLNDGVDGYSSAPGEGMVQDDLAGGVPNWKGGQINCTRDLENFARLWINLNGLQSFLTSSTNTVQIGLKWQTGFTGTPAINIYASADPGGSASYLNDPSGTAEQAQITAPFGQAINDVNGKLTVDTNGTFILPQSVWGLTQAKPVGHFLFEGAGEGTGQLTIVILDPNGNELGEGPSIYMDLKNIKELYERWTVGDGNGGTPYSTAGISSDRLPPGVRGLQYSSGLPGLSVTGDPNQNSYILFVHGWNMPPWEKDAFAETALKRLYWQGYKGKFGTFEWPTTFSTSSYEYFADAQEIKIYDDGEFSAWQSGAPLERLLISLHGAYGVVNLLAHSMGNVVAGEALRIAGQSGAGQLVNTYVASQAAVPGHCYDPTLTDRNLLDFNNINVLGHSLPGLYGPVTPNIYNNWMMPPSLAMSGKANFYNVNDYALNYWQGDQVLKPDSRLYTYFYSGSASDSPAQDLFGKTLLGIDQPLHLGNATNVQDRYEIMAYDAEPRSKALGGVPNAVGFAPTSLQGLWLQDPFETDPSKLYSDHPWHSAQFRFTNADQEYYWQQIMIKFGNVPNTLPSKP